MKSSAAIREAAEKAGHIRKWNGKRWDMSKLTDNWRDYGSIRPAVVNGLAIVYVCGDINVNGVSSDEEADALVAEGRAQLAKCEVKAPTWVEEVTAIEPRWTFRSPRKIEIEWTSAKVTCTDDRYFRIESVVMGQIPSVVTRHLVRISGGLLDLGWREAL